MIGNLRRGYQQFSDKITAYAAAVSPVFKRIRFCSNSLKLLNIVIGVVLASKGLFDNVLGIGPNAALVITSVLGLTIALSGAIEASFQLEKRAARLNILSATCMDSFDSSLSRWRREVGSWEIDTSSDEGRQRLSRLHNIAISNDETLKTIRSQAAELGLNTTEIDLSTGHYSSVRPLSSNRPNWPILRWWRRSS